MASQIITLKSPTTGLFRFQKFVHDNPQSFVMMAYYEGNPSAEGDSPHKGPVMWKVFSTPWRLMITYKRQKYMWNNIHLMRQIVCMRIPDNAIFWVIGLDQHGLYIDI